MKGEFLVDHNNVVTWVPSKMIAKRLEMGWTRPSPVEPAPLPEPEPATPAKPSPRPPIVRRQSSR